MTYQLNLPAELTHNIMINQLRVVDRRRAMSKQAFEACVTTYAHPIIVEDFWEADVVRTYAPRFIHFQAERARTVGGRPFKAATIQEWCRCLVFNIQEYAHDQGGRKCGHELLKSEGLFTVILDQARLVLGLIAIIAIQRAIHKILISVFISREFKHDETNRAWWTGQWYGRGLGTHVMSQPAREYVVKIVELSLWSGDFLLGHFLLFFLSVPTIIPYADQIHATGLFWLRPSKQIRAPLYSIKQKRQRRGIVVKFTFVFLVALIIFVALIALPAIFHNSLKMNCAVCKSI
ncbi:1,3-beta-D-glucan synthase [Ceratobasidium sp. 395]|nr:1,3-beta-D-glucan synthase [Ceratobasidium sp. 395]